MKNTFLWCGFRSQQDFNRENTGSRISRPILRLVRKALCGVAFGAVWVSVAFSAPGSPVVELFPDPVVAKGKGFEIKQSEVDDAIASLKASLATQNQPFPDRERDTIAAKLLDRLVLTRILLQKATDEDRAKAKELADKFIANTKSKALSEESYRRQVRAAGMTPELFEKRAYEQALVETVLARELKPKISVSEDEVRDFYERGIDYEAREIKAAMDRLAPQGTEAESYLEEKKKFDQVTRANLAKLERPEQVRANIIVLYTIDRLTKQELPEAERQAKLALANRLLERLKAGESWSDLARQYSDDLDVQRNNGEYVITRTAPAIPELVDLKTMLFELPINETVGPLTNKLGFYIVRVLEHTSGGKMPFDKAASDIRELLINQQMQKLLPAYAEQLKKEFNVEINLNK